ncbi:hypothetical protein SEA_ALONE_219 [Streptomyces phage Alone3]|nr:hypothetical protein SEA_ALONE_219 [Streptomyces phage Alone3]
MEGTQLGLFNPGEHEHVYRLTQGPHETHPEITLSHSGSKWCWTCGSWVTEYRDGQWLSWDEADAHGYTWRDQKGRK